MEQKVEVVRRKVEMIGNNRERGRVGGVKRRWTAEGDKEVIRQ